MKIYQIDFNPNWGTRFQTANRFTFGPYSKLKLAEAVRKQIATQMGWSEDSPCLAIESKDIDQPQSVYVENGKIIETQP